MPRQHQQHRQRWRQFAGEGGGGMMDDDGIKRSLASISRFPECCCCSSCHFPLFGQPGGACSVVPSTRHVHLGTSQTSFFFGGGGGRWERGRRAGWGAAGRKFSTFRTPLSKTFLSNLILVLLLLSVSRSLPTSVQGAVRVCVCVCVRIDI